MTHSVLKFLQGQISDLEAVYDLTSISPEILRDHNTWLECGKVEAFLQAIESEYIDLTGQESLMQTIGHHSPKLNAWGVLDSVLKMMPHVQDLYAQPQRFLSYFISPAPPVDNVERKEMETSFDTLISSSEYPYTCDFLSAAFESLPGFIGEEFASVKWFKTRVSINWNQNQKSMLKNTNDDDNRISPDLIQKLLSDLEKNDTHIENLNREIREKELIIDSLEFELKALKIKGESTLEVDSQHPFFIQSLNQLQNSFMILSDYMGRAQQLVTILTGLTLQNKPQKEALKRLDWLNVQAEFPNVVMRGIESLKTFKSMSQISAANDSVNSIESKSNTNLNMLLEECIDDVLRTTDKNLHVQKLLFYDRDFSLYPNQLKAMFHKLFQSIVEQIEIDGFMRVVARPKGKKVEIEISDTFTKINEDFYLSDSWRDVLATVKNHKGYITSQSSGLKGQTYLIELSH